MYDGKPIKDKEAISKRNIDIIAEKEGVDEEKLVNGLKILLACLMVVATIAGASAVTYIEGDSVITDNEQATLITSPHTVNGDGFFTVNITSKEYTGEVYFGMCINTEHISLISPLQYWSNRIIEYNINGTNYQKREGWKNYNGVYYTVDSPYAGKNKCYFIQNVNITKDISRLARIRVKAPYLGINELINNRFSNYDGKVDIVLYPSTYDFTYSGARQAYIDGNMIIQDPTINLTNGLLAYYTFDNDDLQTSTLIDKTGNVNLTKGGNVLSGINGKIKQSFNFTNGGTTSGYHLYNSGTGIWTGGDHDRSISLWWLPNSETNTLSNNAASLFQAGDTTSSDELWAVNYEWDNNRFRSSEWGDNAYINYAGLSAHEWIHIVVNYKAANDEVSIWVNGTLVGNESHSDASALTSNYIWVGSGGTGSGSTDNNGLIDEVAIFDRVLNTTEITALYNNSLGCSYSYLLNGCSGAGNITPPGNITTTNILNIDYSDAVNRNVVLVTILVTILILILSYITGRWGLYYVCCFTLFLISVSLLVSEDIPKLVGTISIIIIFLVAIEGGD